MNNILTKGVSREAKYHFVVLMLLLWFLITFSTTKTISNFYLSLRRYSFLVK